MLVVPANTDPGPAQVNGQAAPARLCAGVSRVGVSPPRTKRVVAIMDSFAGFTESNGEASSASLHTERSLGVAELRRV
jgi:hypothetical protein